MCVNFFFDERILRERQLKCVFGLVVIYGKWESKNIRVHFKYPQHDRHKPLWMAFLIFEWTRKKAKAKAS